MGVKVIDEEKKWLIVILIKPSKGCRIPVKC
jgi:hypothetical protein